MNTKPNVYIVNTQNGRGSVYDKEIFDLSLQELRKYNGELWKEEDKVEYIKAVYCKDNIKKTDFFKRFNDKLEAIKKYSIGTIDKEKAQSRFREIYAVSVIPECMRVHVQPHIANLISKDRELKRDAYRILRDYSMSIPLKNLDFLRRQGISFDCIYDTDYYYADMKYTPEKGLEYKIDDELENNFL